MVAVSSSNSRSFSEYLCAWPKDETNSLSVWVSATGVLIGFECLVLFCSLAVKLLAT